MRVIVFLLSALVPAAISSSLALADPTIIRLHCTGTLSSDLNASTLNFNDAIDVFLSSGTVTEDGKTYPVEITDQSFRWNDGTFDNKINRFDGSFYMRGTHVTIAGTCEPAAQRF